MNQQKGLGSQKSQTEQRNSERQKSQINQRLEGQKSLRRVNSQKTASSHQSRIEPQRLTPAGPMAATSQRTARKSFAITGTLITKQSEHVQSRQQQRENTTVHTNTPALETRSQRSEHQGPIYTGDVNLMSIM